MKAIIENEKYKTYEEYDYDGNCYYLTVPNNNTLEYQIFCSLNETYPQDKETLSKANKLYQKITENNKNVVYVHIILEIGELTEAAKDNDTPLYSFLLKRLLKTTKDAYQKTISEKLAGINNKLTIITQNEDDAKFVDWLEINQVMSINRFSLNKNEQRKLDDNILTPFEETNNSSGTPLTQNSITNENEPKTRKKIPPQNSRGFGNIMIIIITLTISLIVGITIAYTIIK